ncbi:hypothetical protein ACHAXN_011203 [Cyclotella atomus]
MTNKDYSSNRGAAASCWGAGTMRTVTMGQCQSANIKGLLKTAIWAPVPAASRICALPIVCASINHVIGDGGDNSTMGRFLLENTIETEVVTPYLGVYIGSISPDRGLWRRYRRWWNAGANLYSSLGFLPKHAIPISNVTVFGGAIANTLVNAGRRHPYADRFTAYSTFSKSITMCRTETLTMIDKELKESLIDKNKQTSTPNNSSSSSCNDEEEACDFVPTDAEDNISGSLESIIERERYAKPRNVVLVAFTFLVVTTPNILKGGGGY